MTDDLRAALDRSWTLASGDPDAVRIVHAPGRVNLIGEHTDYNEGFVLPVAIERGITIAFVPTDDRRVGIVLHSTGEEAGFDLDAIGPRRGSWIDYVAGTAWALERAGATTRGFRAVLASDLPSGAGLGSSAALELAAAWALSGGRPPGLDPMAVAQAAQRAENDYVGVACGLMDQVASTFGEPRAAVFLDCRTLEHRAIPLPTDEIALVVCHSGSSRRLDTSAYNERRAQCDAAVTEIAAREPGVTSLRDVDAALLDRMRPHLDPRIWSRARHVVTENARVLATVAAIEAGDVAACGRLWAGSQASLRDDYEVSSPELDALVEIAGRAPGVLAARLTGAGFGGCTVNLVRRDALDTFGAVIEREYPRRTRLRATVIPVEPASGARLVS
jgi:galactokinase